ncbi:MAG: molybdate ABC transporter substrate-binding protein [Pontiellaceae bacterium]|nr:molybdate ABC transporter substrate-binding protein [Pontiellaceae bacterium]
MKKILIQLTAIVLFSLRASAEIMVFSAASTTDVMKELAAGYKASGGEEVRFNFASSGDLARQIEAGAPAQLFLSANTKWMDYLAEKKLLIDDTRTNLVMNTLVLITPKNSTMTYEAFPANLKGMLAVGDFKSVPAGTYAEASLKSLGWLDKVQGKLVKGSNVRTVLMYVERGEVDAGIVYRTDAIQSDKVKITGIFPDGSHPEIVYPAACLKGGDAAKGFLTFIQSDAAKVIWEKYGFVPPPSRKTEGDEG